MPDKLPTDCSDCPNLKTVHLTQIVGGEVNKLHVCSSCKLATEAGSPDSMDIVCEMAAPTVPPETGVEIQKSSLACPSCGFSEDAFKEFGRLGCPHCYDVFSGGLEPVLRKAHSGTQHKGKIPEGKDEHRVDPAEIEVLKLSLKAHVAKEEYEKAAELRDRIWELESKL